MTSTSSLGQSSENSNNKSNHRVNTSKDDCTIKSMDISDTLCIISNKSSKKKSICINAKKVSNLEKNLNECIGETSTSNRDQSSENDFTTKSMDTSDVSNINSDNSSKQKTKIICTDANDCTSETSKSNDNGNNNVRNIHNKKQYNKTNCVENTTQDGTSKIKETCIVSSINSDNLCEPISNLNSNEKDLQLCNDLKQHNKAKYSQKRKSIYTDATSVSKLIKRHNLDENLNLSGNGTSIKKIEAENKNHVKHISNNKLYDYTSDSQLIENISSDIENDNHNINSETISNEERFKEMESQEMQIVSHCEAIIKNTETLNNLLSRHLQTPISPSKNVNSQIDIIAKAFNETLNIMGLESIIDTTCNNMEKNVQNVALPDEKISEDTNCREVDKPNSAENIVVAESSNVEHSNIEAVLTYKHIIKKILENTVKTHVLRNSLNYQYDLIHRENMEDKCFITKKSPLPDISFKRLTWSVECDAELKFNKSHKCFKSINSFAHPTCTETNCQNGNLILNFFSVLSTGRTQIKLCGHKAHKVVLGLSEDMWKCVCYSVYSLGRYYYHQGNLNREYNLLQTRVLDLLIKTTPRFKTIVLLYQKDKGNKHLTMNCIEALENIDIESSCASAKLGLAPRTSEFMKNISKMHSEVQHFKNKISELSSKIGLLEADTLCTEGLSEIELQDMLNDIKTNKILLSSYRDKYVKLNQRIYLLKNN